MNTVFCVYEKIKDDTLSNSESDLEIGYIPVMIFSDKITAILYSKLLVEDFNKLEDVVPVVFITSIEAATDLLDYHDDICVAKSPEVSIWISRQSVFNKIPWYITHGTNEEKVNEEKA